MASGRQTRAIQDNSLVWTPLPLITWLIPLIGHAGVSNSKGIIYDFSGDFNVSVDNFSFGSPSKLYKFDLALVDGGAKAWDEAIIENSACYAETRHSLLSNNCHRFVAGVLNKVKYANRADWTQFHIWLLITFQSKYLGWSGFARQWCPFLTIFVLTLVALCVVI